MFKYSLHYLHKYSQSLKEHTTILNPFANFSSLVNTGKPRHSIMQSYSADGANDLQQKVAKNRLLASHNDYYLF